MKSSTQVLIGFDGGPQGEDAIREGLLRHAHGLHDMLHVAHVLQPNAVIERRGEPVLTAQARELADAQARVEMRVRFVAELNRLPYHPELIKPHVRIGPVADTLLQLCVDYDVDLLVVGTHDRHGIDRLLLGSVAEELVRKARCPVLIVRKKPSSQAKSQATEDAALRSE